jgi:predicted ABC-type ATPase
MFLRNASLPIIYVLAGANGCGKSSIGGEMIRAAGADYYNADEEARRLRRDFGHEQAEANSIAWHIGRALLERAIQTNVAYAFETTLGGHTISALLADAAEQGRPVKIWFCGLESAEKHLERVRRRVQRGGHFIPEAKIRERFDKSRERLIDLLPLLAELKIYDNSIERADAEHEMPSPRLVLHTTDGIIGNIDQLGATPQWAKPIVAAAIRVHGIHAGATGE